MSTLPEWLRYARTYLDHMSPSPNRDQSRAWVQKVLSFLDPGEGEPETPPEVPEDPEPDPTPETPDGPEEEDPPADPSDPENTDPP